MISFQRNVIELKQGAVRKQFVALYRAGRPRPIEAAVQTPLSFSKARVLIPGPYPASLAYARYREFIASSPMKRSLSSSSESSSARRRTPQIVVFDLLLQKINCLVQVTLNTLRKSVKIFALFVTEVFQLLNALEDLSGS